MSGINPRRPNLFVVREATPPATGTLVNLENLDAKQTKVINRYLNLSKTSGVCVGALCGGEEWDLRPVVIEGGIVTVTRFADPDLMLHKTFYDSLRTIHMRLAANNVAGFRSCGEGEGQLWLKRKFYNGTLGDALRLGEPPPPIGIEQIQKLIALVHAFHDAGLFHGHLSPSNLALEDDTLIPLDYGFCSYSNRKATTLLDLAPELQSGFQPTFATDIFGLGQVIRKLCSHMLTEDHQRFINGMLAPDPFARPAMHRVEGVFRSLGAHGAGGDDRGGPLHTSPRKTIKAGRVIETGRKSESNQYASVRQPEYIQSRQPQVMQPQIDPYAAELLARGHLVPPFEQQPEAAVQPRQAAQAPSNSSSNQLFMLMVIAVSVILYFSPVRLDGIANVFNRSASAKPKAVPLMTLWKSGQPSMMQQVATAAVRMDAVASSVIVKDILEGGKPPLVRTDVIRTTFDNRWQAELSDTDKLIALKLALYQILPATERALPSIDDAHPGVLLALIGNMKLESDGKQFARIAISRMATLPSPIGTAFDGLGKLGVENMEDLSAKALSHIMLGDISENVLVAFFSGKKDIQTSFAKAALLMPVVKNFPDLENKIYDVLASKSEEVGARVAWFVSEKLAGWDKVGTNDMLGIMGGHLPKSELSFEQLADLLKYPAESVRKEAAVKLKEKYFAEQGGGFLGLLMSTLNKLTRAQNLATLVALRQEGESAYTAMNKLFETKPDPQTMLYMLMTRSSMHALDPFNVSAARYLKNAEWKAGLEELKKLLLHPEPMARALAYSRLDAAKPDEAAVLKKMLTLEPHVRLKEEIKRKLELRAGQ